MTHPSPGATSPAGTRRRPIVDRRAVLVRRSYVCDYEAGERPLPAADRVLRFGRPVLLPLTTLACVDTTDPVVALTYDDGPDPDFTPGILDALATHGARATFFVLVEPAEAHPELIARIVAEGHELGLHGIDHTRLNTVPARRSTALVRAAKQRLEQVAGRPITLYRPTYGAHTLPQLVATRALGLDVVIWTAWAQDWDGSAAEVIAERAVRGLHHGGFVLLHDASGDGVGALPAGVRIGEPGGLDRVKATELILAGMADRGYTSDTVSHLLAEYPPVRTLWPDR